MAARKWNQLARFIVYRTREEAFSMKRAWFFVFISVYLCLCLLASCAAGGGGEPAGASAEEQEESTTLCRVVSEEDGTLLLAEMGSTGMFALSLEQQDMTLDGKDFDPSAPGAYGTLPAGTLVGTTVQVTYTGGIQESWPLGFSGVTALAFSTEEFNDLGALYLRVLEDLWEVDTGLNSDLAVVGVDLSGTSLSYTERSAVAYAFGVAHGVTAVEGTWDELVEQGYITGEALEGGGDAQFYQWEDGCLFTIEESDEPVVFSMPSLGPGETVPGYDAVAFDAQKWRSSLGAYFFSDCTAVSNGDGHWDSYTVGAEMIS